MPTIYVRRVSVKDSLSDAEVVVYWKFIQEEFIPVALNVQGVRSVKLYSGAGGLRADMRAVFEMEDAGAYERLLADPQRRRSSPKSMRPGTCEPPVRRPCVKLRRSCFERSVGARDRIS